MRSKDSTKSGDSTESFVSGFIDIRQDTEHFPLGWDNIDHDTEDSIEWEFILGNRAFDSCILTKIEDKIEILSLLPSTCPSSAPQLLYRASRDGWGADAFLLKCKGKVNTITVIKSTEGNVFGGYLDSSWKKSERIVSSHAFLFFLKHNEQLTSSKKMSVKDSGYFAAFISSQTYGFGVSKGIGFDLNISSNANLSASSSTKFGNNYENLSNHSDPTHSNGFIRYFQAVEIEVFELIKTKK